MRKQNQLAKAILAAFFVVYFAIAFFLNQDFPVLVVAGEESPGTWMSGMLLICSAAIALINSARQGWWPWSFLFFFFIALALDERFMFHEQLKAAIIFNYGKAISPLLYELPVIVAAGIGVCISVVLWLQLDRTGRVLLVCAAVQGMVSVVFDIRNTFVFFEETLKLLAELLLVLALLRKVE